MMNLSNNLLKVSLKACCGHQIPVYVKSQFKCLLSSHAAGTLSISEDSKPRPTRRATRTSNENMFMNRTSKIERKETFKFDGDPDVFGTIGGPSAGTVVDEEDFDEGDRRETRHLEHPVDRSHKLSTKQYADMIKAHLKNKNLKEAIDVLQERMLKQDRAKPENYIYNLLIGACGRMGQAKQAFHLFNQMKKRSLQVTGGTYTALFNACATTAYPNDGLKRANHLRELMLEKSYEPNDTNYHAMIKAYGRCGDIKTAFSLVDEMITKRHSPTTETFNFLLQACISDRESGFRTALVVWRKMRDHNIAPSIYTYNLLLRTVRDCGLGDILEASKVLRKITNSEDALLLVAKQEDESNLESCSQSNLEEPKPMLQIHAHHSETQERLQDAEVEKYAKDSVSGSSEIDKLQPDAMTTENWPNFLGPTAHLGDIVSLSEFVTPQDRLLMLGGCSGFLAEMARDRAEPNVKTFTQMLDVIPGTIAAEKALMSAMNRAGVLRDIDWYNMLIKKRSMRCDYVAAQQVLALVAKAKLAPNQLTFGVLALGCRTEEDALKLLQDMDQAGFGVNVEILGAMLKQACIRWNFGYVMEIMETAKRLGVAPNAQFYQHLYTFHTRGRQMIYDKEKGRRDNEFVDHDYFRKGFKLFCARYKNWLREVQEKVPPSKLHKLEENIRDLQQET